MRTILQLNVIVVSLLLVTQQVLAEPLKQDSIGSTEVFFNHRQNSLEHNELARRFQNPLDSARPGVYWYFMDGKFVLSVIVFKLN